VIGIFPTNGGGTNVMEMKCCKSHGKKPTLRYFSTSFPSIGILGFFPVQVERTAPEINDIQVLVFINPRYQCAVSEDADEICMALCTWLAIHRPE